MHPGYIDIIKSGIKIANRNLSVLLTQFIAGMAMLVIFFIFLFILAFVAIGSIPSLTLESLSPDTLTDLVQTSFTLISLGIIMALLQMVLMGTKMSASQKVYRNSLEASYGGVEAFTKEIIPWYIDAAAQNTIESRLQLQTNLANLAPAFPGGAPQFFNYSCMRNKLTLPSSQWGAVCGASAT